MLFQTLASFYIFIIFNFGLGSCMRITNAENQPSVHEPNVPADHIRTKRAPPQVETHFQVPPRDARWPHLTQKRFPPNQGVPFAKARCGATSHSESDLIHARDLACSQLPFNFPNPLFRISSPYMPKDNSRYPPSEVYYLYPLGEPIFSTLRTQHYGLDRVVINDHCELVGVITELPKLGELASKTGRLLGNRPQKPHYQDNFRYVECRLSPKVPISGNFYPNTQRPY